MSAQPINEEEIFAAAIEIGDRDERRAYLGEACGDDRQLRASVAELLTLHDTADGILETPALGPTIELPEERAGDLIDRYRLVEQLGVGGFGVVWRAESAAARAEELAAYRRLAPDHPALARELRELGFLLRQLDRQDEAADCYREALEIQRRIQTEPLAIVFTLHDVADFCREAGDLVQAESYLREAGEITEVPVFAQAVTQLVYLETLIGLRKSEEARLYADDLVSAAEQEDSSLSTSVAQIAEAQLLMAASDYERALQTLNQTLAALHRRVLRVRTRVHLLMSESNLELRRLNAAESDLLHAESESQRDAFDTDQRRIAKQLVALYESWEKLVESDHWRKQLRGERY